MSVDALAALWYFDVELLSDIYVVSFQVPLCRILLLAIKYQHFEIVDLLVL